MKRLWTLEDIMQAAGGQHLQGTGLLQAESVSTDTRSLQPGDVFLALQGERFDGHDFLSTAIERGAGALVVSESFMQADNGQSLDGYPAEIHTIVVRDTLLAYGALAKRHRRNLGIPLVAVTGSVGKSSTRRFIASVLAEDFTVLETDKNENNTVGVPKTILRTTPSDQIIVAELGIDRPGEMEILLRASQPDVGAMVGITHVHLDELGNLDGVAREKARLLEAVRHSGWAVLNLDTPRASYFASRCGDVLTYSTERSASIAGLVTGYTPDGCAEGEIVTRGCSYSLRLRTPGLHQFRNALAAWAIGELYEIDPKKRVRAIERYEGFPGRFTLRQAGCGARIVDDTYNANPSSFRAALETLRGMTARRRIVVAGDMYELGDLSEELHRELGSCIEESGIDRLVTVGLRSKQTAKGALEAGMPSSRITVCEDKADAVQSLAGELHAGDLVLVKGSRGMTMEKVVEALLAKPEREVNS